MSQLTSPVEIYWISGSPFAWRVLLTAEVKGIPYEGKLLEASKGELKTPEFLAINPLGRVPTICDGNFTLHESLAIMVYLDRKHPNPPLFGRTAEEAGRIFERISEFISDFWPPGQRLIRSIGLYSRQKGIYLSLESYHPHFGHQPTPIGRGISHAQSSPWEPQRKQGVLGAFQCDLSASDFVGNDA